MAREVWVEMSRFLGFVIDWFRSNVRVILQYSVSAWSFLHSKVSKDVLSVEPTTE